MPKKQINPTYQDELADLMEKIDDCGKRAARLMHKGVEVWEIKAATKRQLGYSMTQSTARKIMAAIFTVW